MSRRCGTIRSTSRYVSKSMLMVVYRTNWKFIKLDSCTAPTKREFPVSNVTSIVRLSTTIMPIKDPLKSLLFVLFSLFYLLILLQFLLCCLRKAQDSLWTSWHLTGFRKAAGCHREGSIVFRRMEDLSHLSCNVLVNFFYSFILVLLPFYNF